MTSQTSVTGLVLAGQVAGTVAVSPAVHLRAAVRRLAGSPGLAGAGGHVISGVPVHEDSGALGQGAARIGVTRVGGLDRLPSHYSSDFELNNFESRHHFRFYLYFRIHSKH